MRVPYDIGVGTKSRVLLKTKSYVHPEFFLSNKRTPLVLCSLLMCTIIGSPLSSLTPPTIPWNTLFR